MASLPLLRPQLLPRPESAETWLTRKQFCDLTGRTIQWLSNQCRIGNVRKRTTDRRLANGRHEEEFAASSLPPKARAKFEANQQKSQPQTPAQLTLATLTGPQPVAVAPRVILSAASTREAIQKRELLTPILDWINAPTKPHGLRLADGTEVRTQTDMMQWVAEQRTQSGHPVSLPTLKRALKAYREGGESALAKKPRKDAGQSRWFVEHPEAAALVAFVGFADGTHVSARDAYRALLQQAHQLNIAADECPSEDTVRRFLDSAPADLKVLARKGEKKYGDLVMPHMSRRYDDIYANQVWIADTMKADVFTRNDVFDWLPKYSRIRLQLSAIVDYRSRYFVGWCWGLEESSVPIGAALRNALLAHGPAEHFYCDNGKAYKKVARGAYRGYMVTPGMDLTSLYEDVNELEMRLGILARLGMSVTHCIPRHPQSKHIERQFNTVHRQYDTMWTQAYTGGAPHLRPEISGHVMAHHDQSIRHGKPEDSMLPLASAYIQGFSAWVEWHHQQPMEEDGMDGRSPAAVMAEERNPRQRPIPTALELAGTFEERTERAVIRGAVELHGDRYMAAYGDAHAASVMLSLSGDSNDRRRVQVLHDTHDHSSVAIADEYGRVLCTLVRETKLRFAPHDEATKEQISQGMQRARGSLRATKGKLSTIQRAGRLIGARTRLELLADNTPSSPGPVSPALISQPKTPRKIAPQATAPMSPLAVAKLIDSMED